MQLSRAVLLAVITSLTSVPAFADSNDATPSVETILKKWQKASRNCKILDTQFTRYTYDEVFLTVKTCRGRFYYESPNQGRYEVTEPMLKSGSVKRRNRFKYVNYRPLSATREAFIWTSSYFALVNQDTKSYEKWQRAEFKSCRKQIDDAKNSRSSKALGKTFECWPIVISQPEYVLPLVVNVHSQHVLDKYVFTLLKATDDKIWLTAAPRKKSHFGIRSVTVILDTATYMPMATSVNLDTTEIVHVFHDAKTNQQPSDRAELLKPSFDVLRNARTQPVPQPVKQKLAKRQQPKPQRNSLVAVIAILYLEAFAPLHVVELMVDPKYWKNLDTGFWPF